MRVFDPSSPAFLECPYPDFRHFRESQPILWEERSRRWFVFRHQDCVRLLQHPALSNQTYTRKFARYPRLVRWAFRDIGRTMLAFMLFQDSPAHERLRGSVARYLQTEAT